YLSRTPRPDSVTLELPAKSLLKATGQAADARNLSVRDHDAIVASTITAGGGDLQQVTLSVACASRQSRANRREICSRITEQFEKPKFVVAHWDFKLIKYLSGLLDDTIAILISVFP
ncbi:Uncharacterized protein APZ42_008091, partial [Daphnia magna]